MPLHRTPVEPSPPGSRRARRPAGATLAGRRPGACAQDCRRRGLATTKRRYRPRRGRRI